MQRKRTIVITGAAGGIGGALVRRFLSNGDTVVGIDIRHKDLDGSAALSPSAENFIALHGDIADPGACATFAGHIRAKTGSVDVLINCAGYYPIRAFKDMTLDEWRQILDINLTGTFLMICALLPLMKAREGGRIINFGSASVIEGIAGQAHYVSAKAGIVGLSRCLAVEFGGYGITVNVITPGLTLTEPVMQNFAPEILEQQRNVRALHQDQQPEDLAGPVFFLASEEVAFITGQIINVDGGNAKH